MTEKLFLDNSYLKEFEAKVVNVNDKYIILDKTLFYPKSGGQVNDTGTLTRLKDNKEFQVVFAVKVNDDINHEVSEAGLQVNDMVRGKINWDRRYKLMRIHTAVHILCSVASKEKNVLIIYEKMVLGENR